MLDGTYSGLVASVGDFLNRADLSAAIADFIILAEADMNRKLRVRLMQAQVTTSVSAQFATAPSDFAGIISMRNAVGQPITVRSSDAINDLTYQQPGNTGDITDVAVYGGAFQFYPVPPSAQAVTMTYYQRIPTLSANPTGNWVSLTHPDIYLYGALTAAAPYLQDDARVQVWGALYQNAIDSILMQSVMESTGARLAMQPSAAQVI